MVLLCTVTKVSLTRISGLGLVLTWNKLNVYSNKLLQKWKHLPKNEIETERIERDVKHKLKIKRNIKEKHCKRN
jgi:hypothetical protein